MDSLFAVTEEESQHIPNLELCQKVYRFEVRQKNGQTAAAEELRLSILEDITRDNMGPYYSHLCAKYGWKVDESLTASLIKSNEEELAKIEATRQYALENAGDMEVLDAMFAKARLLAKIGDPANAFIAYDAILNKEKITTGRKIDAMMEKARVAFFAMDTDKLKTLIADAKRLNDAGGDWDRRNRLKVYEALYLIICRDLKKASELLLECIQTFTCVEMCAYNKFIFYTIATSVFTLSRSELKTQMVKNPHVISVMREEANLEHLLTSIYECEYADFFRAIVENYPVIADDRYLGPHISYLIREYRVVAYSQFLEAYKSVMLSSMAASFGITVTMLDQELSRFIAAGRLNAKIDKVGDNIETSRPDKKNHQYQEVIKKGDALLNQIQKLARVIQM